MLKNKTALVTGSTSGIGLGIAKALARQGARVVLNGFGDVDGARAEVQSLGAEVGYHGADMSKPAEIADLIAYAERDFGGVDVLVNNAGIQYVALVEEFPVERWDAVIAINLTSAFHTMRLALPGMKSRQWGRVIKIASAHGLVASAHIGSNLLKLLVNHWRDGECDLPRLGAHPTGTKTSGCPRGARRRGRRRSKTPSAGGQTALTTVHDTRATGRAGGVFVRCSGGQRARRGVGGGWRLDGSIAITYTIACTAGKGSSSPCRYRLEL